MRLNTRIHIFEYMNTSLFELHAELCKALSDPKRLEILYLLGKGEKSVSELLKDTKLRQANLSQHLAVLRQKGVVKSRRRGKNILYRIAFPKMVKACNLIRVVLLEQIEAKQRITEGTKK